MIKKYQNFFLLGVLSLCFLHSSASIAGDDRSAVQILSPSGLIVSTTMMINDYSQTLEKVEENVGLAKEKLVNGSLSFLDEIEDAYDEATQAVDSYMEDQYKQASSWVSDQLPGQGFVSDGTKKRVKGAFTAMGKVAAPAVALASGNISGAADLGKKLFIGKANTTDKLSSYDAGDVQKNVKKYIQDATVTSLADASQIIGVTALYNSNEGGTAKSANDAASRSSTVKEDIRTVTEMGISMNVMTNVLLSMDITELSIQSALIYSELNNMKNMNLRVLM